MRSRRATRTLCGVILAVVWTLFVIGGAYAFWSGTGSGTGHGTTDTPAAVTLGPGTPVSGLFPGSNSAVTLTVTNANASAARFGSLALDMSQGTGGFAVDSGHATCSVSTLGYTTQTNAGAGWTVPAKVGAVDGSLALSLASALSMDTSAASACQGATFTVYLTAGP